MTAKYTTAAALKAYGLSAQAAFGGQVVAISSEDPQLEDALARAEMEIETITGAKFDRQTVTGETINKAWIDGYGWLWLRGFKRGPVSAISSIQVLDLVTGSGDFQTIAYQSQFLVLPPQEDPPDPDAWTVRVRPNSINAVGRVVGSLLAQVSYTGGYSPIPQSLTALTNRLAWWVYQFRSSPQGKIIMPELGMIQIPLSIPPDIQADLMKWTPLP